MRTLALKSRIDDKPLFAFQIVNLTDSNESVSPATVQDNR